MSFSETVIDAISVVKRVDPDSIYDPTEASRMRAYILLLVSQLSIVILGILGFTQFLGKHRGQSIPMNILDAKGGWDTGNDWAHVVVTVFGLLFLMVCFVLVNDPSRFPLRFTKSYRESVIYSGIALRIVALGCMLCLFVDIDDIGASPACNAGCSRAEYIATCLFDFLTAVCVVFASIAVAEFGELTPAELSTENLQAVDFLHNTLKSSKFNLRNMVPVVAVVAPCCGELVPFSSLDNHVPACEAAQALKKATQLKAKEAAKEAKIARRNQELDEKESVNIVVNLLSLFILVFLILSVAKKMSATNNTDSLHPRKGSLMGNGTKYAELFAGLGCGLMFGVTSAIIGQPFDSVKTKMQAQKAYMEGGMIHTFKKVIKTEGVIGLYRGILPPLLGSSLFRSIQFGAYNFSYTHFTHSDAWTRKPISYTYGLEPRCLISAFFAASMRSIVECPLEYVKVRQIAGQPWKIREMYTGFSVLWARTCGLMVPYFTLVDYQTRYVPELLTVPFLGSFIKGGVNATICWMLVWPFEVVKNQVQVANLEGPKTLLARLAWLVKTKGIASLYRGFMPGGCRSLVANSIAMLLFDTCQRARHVATTNKLSE